jgi:DNA-binding transcriptional MerR regulator
MARAPATLTISAVARRTGIPITTLRFYERELPALFRIRKTRGGHRRYDEAEVARFVTVRRLTESGLGLAQVRRALLSRGDQEAVREEVQLLAEAQAAESGTVEALAIRIRELEARIAALEAAVPRRRRWLPGREPR